MPAKKNASDTKKKTLMTGFLDNRTPLIALNRCAAEEGTTICVPGDWWQGTPVSEKGLVFKCMVTKWDPEYKWPAGSRDPKVQDGAFTLEVEGRTEQPYEMSRLDYCRFVSKQQPTTAAGDTTLALVGSSSGASDSDGQTAPSDSTVPENTHSKIWEYILKLTTVELEEGLASDEKKTHKCSLCSMKLTQHGKSTSGLLSHMKNRHPIQYGQIIEVSRHAKTRLSDVGTLISIYNFQELAPHHIRFAIWCVVKKRPFFIALDAEFRTFAAGLDPRYRPPHRETCWKIVAVIVELLKVRFLLTFVSHNMIVKSCVFV